jgi:hypothetical protein
MFVTVQEWIDKNKDPHNYDRDSIPIPSSTDTHKEFLRDEGMTGPLPKSSPTHTQYLMKDLRTASTVFEHELSYCPFCNAPLWNNTNNVVTAAAAAEEPNNIIPVVLPYRSAKNNSKDDPERDAALKLHELLLG